MKKANYTEVYNSLQEQLNRLGDLEDELDTSEMQNHLQAIESIVNELAAALSEANEEIAAAAEEPEDSDGDDEDEEYEDDDDDDSDIREIQAQYSEWHSLNRM